MKLNYSADHKEPAPAMINRLHPGQLQSSRENVIISTTALRFRDSVRGLGLSQSTRLGLLLSPGRHRSNPFGASPSSPVAKKKELSASRSGLMQTRPNVALSPSRKIRSFWPIPLCHPVRRGEGVFDQFAVHFFD